MSDAAREYLRLMERITVLDECVRAQAAISRAVTLMSRPCSSLHQDALLKVHVGLRCLVDQVEALEVEMKEAHKLRVIRNMETVQ